MGINEAGVKRLVRKLFQGQGLWNGAYHKKIALSVEEIKGLDVYFGA